ncbi:AAA family ATPase, putative [Cordyceps militaris CM01]|uniref:AAA family ATPase, putative n=1 Tax=Cordyceps militaris (strain CM01) TaxID=983644 RepID=G3J6R4_CORMM|nr:AAA family ATPase, putative [Cordyceps militaris CM01]EGX95392.1 AAA family ATPase, putative [Cordyceps militaris CM01]
MARDGVRAVRLKRIFNSFLYGKRSVSNTHEAEVFFEAAKVQTSPSSCLEAILASPSGLDVVKSSVRASASLQFVSDHVLPFLQYICQTEAKALCEGMLLHQLMVAAWQPPTAWNAIQKHYVAGSFAEKDAEAFAGLCFEIVTYPGPEFAGMTRDFEKAIKTRPFTKSPGSKTRELGYRTQKVLQTRSSSNNVDEVDGLGGRHDNDFTDLRQISIYPSSDELSSTIPPFYRLAVQVSQSDPAQRTARHLDNQFRLLREDMLAELRDDISIATGKQKGKRRSQILKNLVPVGINTGDKVRARQCALRVSVGSGLERLTKLPVDQRKKFLTENRSFLPHQAFGAISSNGTILGFAFAVRNIDDLVRNPALLSLSFCSSETMEKALSNAIQSQNLESTLVDTPVFAYEPVLRRLREITELPLDKHLLQMEDDDAEQRTQPRWAVLGQSEKQTNGILAATVGKVLVIDEAYGLYGGGAASKGGGGFSDPYKVAVMDTIVANVHSTPGDNRCVLLLGYRDQMEGMFQNVNPGLSRRLPLSTAPTDMSKILDLKLKQQGFGVTQTAKQVALDMIERARSRPNFGNAGEVDILLNGAKARHQTRLTACETLRVSTLEALDFDEDHGRTENAETNVAQLFRDTIGCERIVAMLQGYQQTARTTKNLGLDPKEHVPFNFIFRGPPGTGKTTTARKMGKVHEWTRHRSLPVKQLSTFRSETL